MGRVHACACACACVCVLLLLLLSIVVIVIVVIVALGRMYLLNFVYVLSHLIMTSKRKETIVISYHPLLLVDYHPNQCRQ